MDLREFLLAELLKLEIKLPRGKGLLDVVCLFERGIRKAGWSNNTATRFMDQFPERVKNRKYTCWFLEHRGYSYCNQCCKTLPKTGFYSHKGRPSNLSSSCKKCQSNFHEENSALYSKTAGEWNSNNPGRKSNSDAKRRAAKLQRTPKWSEELDIMEFYVNRPKGYHVDHIIPLQGNLVSGLHVLDNLQYLTEHENLKKSNKFNPLSEG